MSVRIASNCDDGYQPINTSPGGAVSLEATGTNTPWQHFMRRGHKGKVNCVTASTTVDYIISGGEDDTMRVWKYDDDVTKAYDLAAILKHTNLDSVSNNVEPSKGCCFDCRQVIVASEPSEQIKGVTSVACCGTQGPFISGTASGTIQMLCLMSKPSRTMQRTSTGTWEENIDSCVALHKDAVNDIFAAGKQKSEEDRHTEYLVGTASEDSTACVLRVQCIKKELVSVDELVTLKHERPVSQIRWIAGAEEGRSPREKSKASMVTCSGESAFLWSLKGERLMELVVHEYLNEAKYVLRSGQQAEPEGMTSMIQKVASQNVLQRMSSSIGVEREATEENQTEEIKPEDKFAQLLNDETTPKIAGSCVRVSDVRLKITAIRARSWALGTLLFAAGDGVISIWELRNGWFMNEDKTVSENTESCPPPILQYSFFGKTFDVDKSGLETAFFVDLRDSLTCAMTKIVATEADKLAIEPKSPGTLLLRPGEEKMILELPPHPSPVTDMLVVEDPDDAGGPALIVGCQDGRVIMWDLEGDDKGEQCAELRSVTRAEVLAPLMSLAFTFLQVVSFAFPPQAPWKEEVKQPAVAIHRVVVMDFDFAFSLDKAAIFWPKTLAVLAYIAFFMIAAGAGLPDMLDGWIHYVQSSQSFQNEVETGSIIAPWHVLLLLCKGLKRIVFLMLFLGSTILVVPTFKNLISVFDCDHPDGSPRFGVLSADHSVECYAGDHFILAFVTALAFPFYLWVLVPYAVVAGDANYVEHWNLVDHTSWQSNAERKATVIHLGPLHPNPTWVYRTLLQELMAKTALPCIAVMTTFNCQLQMCLVTTIGAMMYAHSIIWPPRADDKMCRIVQGLRLFTLSTMFCGLFTVFLNDPDNLAPSIFLAVVAVLVPAIICYQYSQAEEIIPEVILQRSSSSLHIGTAGRIQVVDPLMDMDEKIAT